MCLEGFPCPVRSQNTGELGIGQERFVIFHAPWEVEPWLYSGRLPGLLVLNREPWFTGEGDPAA